MIQRWFSGLVLVVTLLLGQVAHAEIPGQEDEAFQAALAAWLNGEDMAALTAFASLAHADNRAAQIFLGMIEKQTWTHNHVTSDLPRKERIALLRNPKGLSGTNWLTFAALDTPLAQMLLDAHKPYKDSQNAQKLLVEGELLVPLQAITRAFNYGDTYGALEISVVKQAVPYSSGFAQALFKALPQMAEYGAVDLSDPRLANVLLGMKQFSHSDNAGTLMWGWNRSVPNFHELLNKPAWTQAIGKQLAEHPLMPPIVKVVSRHCPNDPESVLTTLQWANIGAPLYLSTLSPVESLLKTETYYSSKRFEDDFLRHAGFNHKDLAFFRAYNQCAADMIEQAAQ